MIIVELCTSNSFLWFSLNEFKKDAHIQLGPKRWSKMLINGILIYYFSFKWIIKIRTIIRISIMYFWIWRTEPKILKISFLLFFNSKILSQSIIILLYLNSNVFFHYMKKHLRNMKTFLVELTNRLFSDTINLPLWYCWVTNSLKWSIQFSFSKAFFLEKLYLISLLFVYYWAIQFR